MTGSGRPIDESDLLALADGRLPPERQAAVEAWLAEHPERATEVQAWRQQNEALTALYGHVAAERLPERLDPHAIARRRRRPALSWAGLAAAAVVVLGLGLGGGWMLRELVSPPPSASARLIDNAVLAHTLYVRENRHAVEVAANERQHLLTWLSNRIQASIDAPDLTAEGFTLVGGRLLPPAPDTGTGPAAQLMYENGAAERLTVYVTGALADGDTAYQFARVSGLDAFYWANARITCTVVGDLPEEAMQMVARKVYQQLTRRPDPGYPRGT